MTMVARTLSSAMMQKLQINDGEKMATLRKRNKPLESNGSSKQNGSTKQKHSRRADKDDTIRKIQSLIQKGRKLDLKDTDTLDLFHVSPTNNFLLHNLPKIFKLLRRYHLRLRHFLKTTQRKKLIKIGVILFSLVTLIWTIFYVVNFIRNSVCLVPSSSIVDEIYRPRMPCGVCQKVRSVPEMNEITPRDLRNKYALTPLVIRAAAMQMATNITYNQLKQGYTMEPHILKDLSEYCQFFPYATEFTSIREVFNMTDRRAGLRRGEEPWYIGWCNCVPSSRELARQMYIKPDFLPGQSIMDEYNWIFMGGPGHGAGLHIDVVQLPSWQAQLSGRKRWHLVPPYECEAQCDPLEVVVNTGDVIILDTNVWFHSTEILPGSISITIGAEFD